MIEYGNIVESLIRDIVQVVVDLCPVFTLEDLSKIYCVPTVPFNEEWSQAFDIAFEGGGDGGNLIAYPNANTFSDALRAGTEIFHNLKNVQGDLEGFPARGFGLRSAVHGCGS
jgi:hypothetical protein